MRLRNKLLSLVAGALALVGVSGSALAVPLSTLVGGASLASLDGTITFSNFSATVTGALSPDLSNYDVQALQTGFRITGAFLVADGNVGDMVLSYDATAAQGLVIDSVHLFFNGSFNGGDDAPPGLAAAVTETVFANGDPVENLSVSASSSGFEKLVDNGTIAPVSEISVLKDIALSTYLGDNGEGSVAHISIIDQKFTVTPEPGTFMLGAMGLAGLAALGRRRVR